MQRLRVIGLIVSKLGIQVNPDRLQAITEFQMPKSKTAVRRLLGMANQYRNHIFRYAKIEIVDPLCRLTEGEWPTRWDSESVPEECHTALEILKTALTSPAVLYRRIYGYVTLAYQHAISAGMCPELIFPYIPYLLTSSYPSGSSPALSRRRKNTGVNLK